MKIFKLLIFVLLISAFQESNAQVENYFYQGRFKKFSGLMSSNHYNPDILEDSLYRNAIRTAFPSDLLKSPEKYTGKLIHLIGIVETVEVEQQDNSEVFTFTLDNKYWDYIEDYSRQDEVMFISTKGDGKFKVVVHATNLDSKDIEFVKKFPAEKKLFLVYGVFKEIKNGMPILTTQQIKYIDYQFYTTKVFSFDIARDKNGEVMTGPQGEILITDFKRLKFASPGQNK